MAFTTFSTIRLLFIVVHYLWMLYALFTGYLTQLGARLARRLRAYQAKTSHAKRRALVGELGHFMGQHQRLHALGLHLDRTLVAGITLVTNLTLTLANIVVLNLILAAGLSTIEMAFLPAIIAIQTFFTLVGARFLIAKPI